ncbi:MAG: hypothetical protein ABRQ39_02000 [Candidatus Eremiobacterota bacterium]
MFFHYIKMVFITSCLIMTLISVASSQEIKTVKTDVNVVNISNIDFAKGTCDIKFEILLQYPDTILPAKLYYRIFQDKLLNKLTEKEKEFLLTYYTIEERDTLTYYVLKHEKDYEKNKRKIYEIIRSTGFYEEHLPFGILNGSIKLKKDNKYDIERMELDKDYKRIYYSINSEIQLDLEFEKYPWDNQDFSIMLISDTEIMTFSLLDNEITLPLYFKYDFFRERILNRLSKNDKELLLKCYEIGKDRKGCARKLNVSLEDQKKIKQIFKLLNINIRVEHTVSVPGWIIKDGEPEIGEEVILGTDYSTFVCPITLYRSSLLSFLKVLFPLFCMVLVSFVGLFIETNGIVSRISLLTSTLLTAAMFHLNATASIPQLSYLTIADKIFLCSYISFIFNLILSILILKYDDKKHEAGVKKIYRFALYSVPALTIGLYLIVLLLGFLFN